MLVLFKGMEMPKSCDKCVRAAWSNFFQIYVCEAIKKDEPVLFNGKQVKSTDIMRSGRADNCQIIEVPTPHGDLIDREWLIDIALHLMHTAKNDEIANGVKWLLQYIIEAPAIIPAEEG